MTEAKSAPVDAAWLVGLLQAGDSFYPTGSYAHSFGLEALVQENVVCDRETLRRFIFLSTLPAPLPSLPQSIQPLQLLAMFPWMRPPSRMSSCTMLFLVLSLPRLS